jgi:hypothetical protein
MEGKGDEFFLVNAFCQAKAKTFKGTVTNVRLILFGWASCHAFSVSVCLRQMDPILLKYYLIIISSHFSICPFI